MNTPEVNQVHFHSKFEIQDVRGSFSKPWQQNNCELCFDNFSPAECYVSKSSKGVIRGFHFQNPPFANAKIISVLEGEILDVSFKISFGKPQHFITHRLNEASDSLYIPKSYAHGFQVLSESATLLYLTDQIYSKVHDAGIHRSVFLDWVGLEQITSTRDDNFPDSFGI